jgi:hypothetical protein
MYCRSGSFFFFKKKKKLLKEGIALWRIGNIVNLYLQAMRRIEFFFSSGNQANGTGSDSLVFYFSFNFYLL